ncbi:MAG: biotin-dependent carboxyltransferase family protein [Chitinophagaceae bacterium]|nr:biotin-dependent carboxyltransferase family protein [Chitinophagaceae bacterium]MCW5929319.1 biotin-dependent carboxyltransferase family protein [Chitinophagaceae bacterium]
MSIRIIRKGVLDSIQDTGRIGYRHWGINPGGAMDTASSAIANLLVGNKKEDAVIEIHFPAPVITIEQTCILAITGADFSATLNGEPAPLYQPLLVAADTELRFKQRVKGSRAYIAFREQLGVPLWLNSYSTNFKAGAGGWNGRTLQGKDVLPFRHTNNYRGLTNRVWQALPWHVVPFPEPDIINILPGPEYEWLSDAAQRQLEEKEFTISTTADRMGYHLNEGLEVTPSQQLLSSGTGFGTIQLLPDGKLIILMADHQVSGGYPRIAQIVGAALPAVAQQSPGEKIRFRICTQEYAEKLYLSQWQHMAILGTGCNLKLASWLEKNEYLPD